MANNTKNFADYAQGKGWGEGGGDFENLPDGSYVGLIVAGSLKQNAKEFWRQEIRIKIQEAEVDSWVGKTYFDHRPFETEKGGWNPWKVREFYEALGLELPDMGDLPEVLSNIVASGMIVTFDLKTKGNFQNMIIVEAHETAMEEAAAAAAKPTKPAKAAKAAPAEKPELSREATKSTERDPEPELPTEEEVEEWDKAQCSEFCQEHDIKEQKTLSKTKAAILSWLEENGAGEEPAESPEDDKDAELKEKLIEFGASIGADLNDGMSVDELKEELLGYEIASDTMTEQEIKFCKENGLEGCIVYPAPKKAAKKK